MRRALPLVVSIAIVLLVSVTPWGWAQDRVGCPNADAGGFSGPEKVRFSIPLGAFGEAVQLLLKALKLGLPLPPGILIPDITVHLGTKFSGDAFVSCSPPCCDRLVMSADLLLKGTATLYTIPPQVSTFTSMIPVVPKTSDFWPGRPETGDRNAEKCAIYREWEHTVHDFQISLSLAGGLISLPLTGEAGTGRALARVLVSHGCEEVEERVVITALPNEVVVPVGREAKFTVAATCSSTRVWLTAAGEPWPRPPLTYSAVSRTPGVMITITPDRLEDGKLIPGGEGVIRVDPQAPVVHDSTEEVVVSACTPDGKSCDQRPMKIRYVRSELRAISSSLTRHAACSVYPEYRAEYQPGDPRLGYALYFVRGSPAGRTGWSCILCPQEWLTPGGYRCIFPARCSGKACSAQDYCKYRGSGCVYLWDVIPLWGSAPKGTYEFPFVAFELRGGKDEAKEATNYGLSSYGVWTLILNNQPPVVTASPSEVRVPPGGTVTATVTAEDPDPEGDWVNLVKVSGPGEFPTAEGRRRVSAVYTWTVPSWYAYGPSWEIVTFRADDN